MSYAIELDEQTAAVVQKLAAEEHRSASEVIRDAMAAYTSVGKRLLPKGTGRHHSGRAETAEKVEEILRDAVKEGRWP